MPAERHQSPIFVVGASRSGTELMRSVLNMHRSVFITPETHYFDDLRPRLSGRERHGLSRIETLRCEDYLLASMHRPYGQGGQADKAPLSREELRQKANEIGLGSDAFFEALCRVNASKKGADSWGEKTPRHVFCLPDIFAAFPLSKVICMVRDPRAAIASYHDLKYRDYGIVDGDAEATIALQKDQRRFERSYSLLIACMLWSASVEAALQSQRQFSAERVLIQRYEDLVLDPVSVLTRLTAWLSIDYCPAMLDVPIINSSCASFQESAGFAPAFTERWRVSLKQQDRALIQVTCRRGMRSMGYAFEPFNIPFLSLIWACLKLPVDFTRAFVANYARIGAIGPYVYRRVRYAGFSLIR